MIKSLHIENFQSHANTELQFSEGVNVILGSSDSGKSGIIRALRWVIYNQPQGQGFRSWWGGDTSVLLKTENNTVQRFRTKKENGYRRNDVTFKAVSSQVPDEILDALNLSDINFQKQGDAPFLLSESSGEVAKHFNQMAGLSKIDSTIKNLNSVLRKNKYTLQYKEEDLATQREKLQKYTYLDQLEKEINKAHQQAEKIDSLKSNCDTLTDILEELDAIALRLVKNEKYLQISSIVDSIDAIRNEQSEVISTGKELKTIIQALTSTESALQRSETIIAAHSTINKIERLNGKKNELKTKATKLDGYLCTLQNITKDRNDLSERIQSYEKLFTEQMPSICPLCGSKIT